MKKYDENRAFALLDKIGFTRVAGSSEELKAAEILKAECESFGLSAVIEPFEIESAEVEATFEILEPYRKSYTVRGYQCAESTAADGLTADFVYVENALPVDLLNVKGKIVLVNGFLRVPLYRSLMEAGAARADDDGGALFTMTSRIPTFISASCAVRCVRSAMHRQYSCAPWTLWRSSTKVHPAQRLLYRTRTLHSRRTM